MFIFSAGLCAKKLKCQLHKSRSQGAHITCQTLEKDVHKYKCLQKENVHSIDKILSYRSRNFILFLALIFHIFELFQKMLKLWKIKRFLIMPLHVSSSSQ